MSDMQFYVSVAVVPTVTIIIVLIGVLLNNTNMNARFGDMNGRFDDINGRLDDLRSEMKAGSGALRSEMNARSNDL